VKIAGRDIDPLDVIVKLLLAGGLLGSQLTQTTPEQVADTVDVASIQWQELMEREVDMAHDRIAYLEGRIARLE
jgi:hypothetical protein